MFFIKLTVCESAQHAPTRERRVVYWFGPLFGRSRKYDSVWPGMFNRRAMKIVSRNWRRRSALLSRWRRLTVIYAGD
jgi:hypothetical protein